MNPNEESSCLSLSPGRPTAEGGWACSGDADARRETAWACNYPELGIRVFFQFYETPHLSFIHSFLHSFNHPFNIHRVSTVCWVLRNGIIANAHWSVCHVPGSVLSAYSSPGPHSNPVSSVLIVTILLADQENGVSIASIPCQRPRGGWLWEQSYSRDSSIVLVAMAPWNSAGRTPCQDRPRCGRGPRRQYHDKHTPHGEQETQFILGMMT